MSKKKEIDEFDYVSLDSSTTIRVNSNMYKRFKDVAGNMGKDASQVLREYMIEYIKENQQKSIFD